MELTFDPFDRPGVARGLSNSLPWDKTVRCHPTWLGNHPVPLITGYLIARGVYNDICIYIIFIMIYIYIYIDLNIERYICIYIYIYKYRSRWSRCIDMMYSMSGAAISYVLKQSQSQCFDVFCINKSLDHICFTTCTFSKIQVWNSKKWLYEFCFDFVHLWW